MPEPLAPQSHSETDEPLSAFHALMQGLIDYAGLYPPAKLGMTEAVAKYASYLRSPQSWMLGRFICPVSRLEEFRAATMAHLPHNQPTSRPPATRPPHPGELSPLAPDTHSHHASEPWPISAIIDGDLDENLDAIFAFNREHAQPTKGLAVVDAIEIKVPGSGSGAAVFIDESLDLIPEEIYPFFELAVLPEKGSTEMPDLRGPIAALSGADAGAKLRSGGVTPDAFPSVDRVAEFIAHCAAADVPFKATAGLHHPVRAEHPLTYEPGCPRGVMHGFLNVFIGAAIIRTLRLDAASAAPILLESDPRAFSISPRSIGWRQYAVDAEQVALARETFALSYGSCSFTEPVDDLKSLGLL